MLVFGVCNDICLKKGGKMVTMHFGGRNMYQAIAYGYTPSN